MALIFIRKEKGEFGRKHEVSLDTDDLSQEDYHEFCRLEREGKPGEAKVFLKKKLIGEKRNEN